MDIEFKNDSVCFADGRYWSSLGEGHRYLVYDNAVGVDFNSLINFKDFQLNTIKLGDCMPKSELDTEDKYNRAVEEFGLFGFVFKGGAADEYRSFNDAESLTCCDDGLWQASTERWNKRKITFNQLMAIGELKRLEIERDNEPQFGKNEDGSMKLTNFSANSNSPNCKTSKDYLNECIEVQNQRGEQYDSKGTGERSFAAAASAFNAMTGQNLKGSDVCLLLTCVKAVRQYSDTTRVHEDSLLDLVSYASLWAEELNKEVK